MWCVTFKIRDILVKAYTCAILDQNDQEVVLMIVKYPTCREIDAQFIAIPAKTFGHLMLVDNDKEAKHWMLEKGKSDEKLKGTGLLPLAKDSLYDRALRPKITDIIDTAITQT